MFLYTATLLRVMNCLMADLKVASKKFLALLKDETDRRKAPSAGVELLRDHTAEIKEARALRVSFEKISEFLTEAGVKTSTDQVRKFCQSALKEAPLKRKKRRKRTATKVDAPQRTSQIVVTKKPTNDGKSARPSKPGFRVARSEDL